MTTLTRTHDSATCNSANGQPCEFCVAAMKYETRQKTSGCNCDLHRLDQTERTKLIDAAVDATNTEIRTCGDVLTTFADDWELAPLSMTRTTERECAEYWYQMGQRAKGREMLMQQSADYREMLRVGKGRV